MRSAAAVCLAALALVACNKPAATTDAGPAAGARPPSAAPPVTAPQPRAGLWEVTPEIAGMQGKVKTCVDARSQGEAAVLGQNLDQPNCTKRDWSRIPNGVAFAFDCDNDGARVTSKGTVTGDFNTAYRMEADATMTRDGQTQSIKQVIDARYLGACPAGMKPGDSQITINGRTLTMPGAPAG